MNADGVACVPWIDEAETLYSYCVFVHRFNRLQSSAATARLMLHAAHATRQHDVPSALGALAQFAAPIFPDPVQALRRHSVAGYYWPFMTDERRHAAAAALLAPAHCIGLRLLGASTRRLAVAHPLKWCPSCLADNLRVLGRPCWLTQHQHPTTFVCSLHGEPLMDAGVGGKTWKWPGDGEAEVCAAVSAETATLAAVGRAASSLSNIDSRRLRASAIDRLADLGVVHSRHAVRHVRLQKWFTGTPVGRWLATAPNGLDGLKSGDWIAKLIWRRPTSHGVRWTALWSALEWNSPEEAGERFLAACRVEGDAAGDGPETTGQIWHRPSAPLAFEKAIDECFSYEAIAAQLGASRSDVVRWFEAHPTLRSQWRKQWLAQRKRTTRDTSSVAERASDAPA